MLSTLPNQGNFSEEQIVIPECCQEFFDKNIKPFNNMEKRYSIALTGQIGVGKSTLCQALKILFDGAQFKLNPIREYINYDSDGPAMLEKFLKGTMTNPTFQNYIMDVYQIQCRQLSDWNVRVIERPVVDSVACFGVLSHVQQKDFTTLQLNALFDRCLICCESYNLPEYDGNRETKFKKILSIDFGKALMEILEIIYDDLKLGFSKRLIGLDITSEGIEEFYDYDVPKEIMVYDDELADEDLIIDDFLDSLKKEHILIEDFNDDFDFKNIAKVERLLIINDVMKIPEISKAFKRFTGRMNTFKMFIKNPDLRIELAFIIHRINQRNRDCEKLYDAPYLLSIHNFYKDIYENTEEGSPFVYSGIFVECDRMRKIMGSPY